MFLIFSGSGPDRLDTVYTVYTSLAVTREVKRGQQENSGGKVWRGFKRASLFVSPRDISANKYLVKLLKMSSCLFLVLSFWSGKLLSGKENGFSFIVFWSVGVCKTQKSTAVTVRSHTVEIIGKTFFWLRKFTWIFPQVSTITWKVRQDVGTRVKTLRRGRGKQTFNHSRLVSFALPYQ